MADGYPYQPLDGSSVRLIRVLDDERTQELIRCELIVRSLEDRPPPDYIAISYTWGDTADNRSIEIDGREVSVPENLWHALFHFRLWAALEAAMDAQGIGPSQGMNALFVVRRPWLLWADSVCINQDDVAEKTRQIPQMMRIFSSAKEVLGWLGQHPPPAANPEMLGPVLSAAKIVGRLAKVNRVAWLRLATASDTNVQSALFIDDMVAFTDVMFALANMPWFKRLWIVQEYAVSQRSVLLALGTATFNAADFQILLSVFAHRPVWLVQPSELYCSITMGRIKERHGIHMGFLTPRDILMLPDTSNDLDAFAQRLQALLTKASMAPFRATRKHDMIYGILSMAGPPEPLPPGLAIDYAQPWWEVCRNYAKFIAGRTASISFLTRARIEEAWGPTPNHEEIPSWVPDFSTMCTSPNYSEAYLVEKDRFRDSEITFSEDGRAMTLDCVVLGKAAALMHHSNLGTKITHVSTTERISPLKRAEAIGFVDQILKVAAERQGRQLKDITVSWVTSWQRSGENQLSHSEAIRIAETFLQWAQGASDDELHLDELLIAGQMFSRRGRAVWRRLRNKTFTENWILTPDGRGWVAMFNHGLSPDDVVVVLRGLHEYPAVLRESSSKGLFRLIGLLIERLPVPSGAWEHKQKDILGTGDYQWTKITLV